MRKRLLALHADLVARRPRSVLAVCLLLCCAAGAALPRLEFRTARSALSSGKDPDIERFDRFLEELGPNEVLLAVEGGSATERRAFLDDFAARARGRRDSAIGGVFHRIPVDFLKGRALGLRPASEIDAIRAAMEEESPALAALARAGGVADLFRALRERMEREIGAGKRPEKEDPSGLRALVDLLRRAQAFLERPVESVAAIEGLDLFGAAARLGAAGPGLRRLANGGYLESRDGSVMVALIQPAVNSDALDYLHSLLGAIRAAADAARGPRPAVRYGLAGLPVTIIEESETVGKDAPRCALLAAAGIGAVALFAFRRKISVLLVLVSLGMGILWSFGLAWACFGGINLITSSVPVILLALGIDFGIHVVLAYESERGRGREREDAVRGALARIGPGLTTGALTTALAFYAICFMQYRGFREFGVIAGNGVIVCLLSMSSALPALLALTDRRAAPAPAPAPCPAPAPGGTPALVPWRRRLWRGACKGITRFPLPASLAALAVTAVFLFLARGIGFDYRVEDLLPRDAESNRTQRLISRDDELSPEFAIVFCRDRRELRAADERAQGEKLIRRRESMLDLLPEEEMAPRAAALASLARSLEPLAIDPARLAPFDPAALRAAVVELRGTFDRALDLATSMPAWKETLRLLEEAAGLLESMDSSIEKAPPQWREGMAAAQTRLWAWGRDRREDVRRMVAAGPVAEAEIPAEIAGKLRGARSGRYALRLYPSEPLVEREAVRRFVAAAKAVDAEATGYPVVFFASTSLIHEGFDVAVAAAAAVILLALLLDFRRPERILLAVLPKLIGIVWMLGIMRLLGLNYNLANQIVVPLLIGVGLSFGIHIIHRFFADAARERDITAVLEETGGSIALSGLTTMIGFGSLSLADHRGLASMGMVLFFGVGAALAASTVVLANVLCLLYLPRR